MLLCNRVCVMVSVLFCSALFVASKGRLFSFLLNLYQSPLFQSLDMRGKMEELAPLITESKEIYEKALVEGSDGDEDGLRKVITEIAQVKPPNVVQEIDDFAMLYEDAAVAQRVLLDAFADEWETKEITVQDKGTEKVVKVQEPVAGKAKTWIENAISPGRTEEDSAKRKMKDNYKGHPNGLTDLARIT